MKFKYYWFLIFALCFTAFNQIQDNVRPNYRGDNLIVKYLLGVAPKFSQQLEYPHYLFLLFHMYSKRRARIFGFLKRYIYPQI